MNLDRNVRARIVELVRLAFGPLVGPPRVHDDLPFGIHFDVRAIHRARRGAFKVDALAVVATAVTWTLELVLARLPIGRAAQVRAACVDDEEPIRSLINPDAI